LRRIQPLGVGYGLDESERVVGVGIAAARHLLSEIALYRRQAVVVPLLRFGISGGARVARGGIGASRAALASALKRAWRNCVRVGYRIGGQLIGSARHRGSSRWPSVLGGRRRSALAFLEALFQPERGLAIGIDRDSPAAARVEFQKLAIEAQQILGLRRVGRAGNGVLGVLQ
jgi:hypothetical protein